MPFTQNSQLLTMSVSTHFSLADFFFNYKNIYIKKAIY